MGLFSGIKNNYKKSEAAVVIQNMLEELKRMGFFDSNPAKVANMMVESAWQSRPDVFCGNYGERPHKLVVAAYSFAYAIESLKRDSQTRTTLGIPFGKLMAELLENGKMYPFNKIDYVLLDRAGGVFQKLLQEMESDPLMQDEGLLS